MTNSDEKKASNGMTNNYVLFPSVNYPEKHHDLCFGKIRSAWGSNEEAPSHDSPVAHSSSFSSAVSMSTSRDNGIIILPPRRPERGREFLNELLPEQIRISDHNDDNEEEEEKEVSEQRPKDFSSLSLFSESLLNRSYDRRRQQPKQKKMNNKVIHSSISSPSLLSLSLLPNTREGTIPAAMIKEEEEEVIRKTEDLFIEYEHNDNNDGREDQLLQRSYTINRRKQKKKKEEQEAVPFASASSPSYLTRRNRPTKSILKKSQHELLLSQAPPITTSKSKSKRKKKTNDIGSTNISSMSLSRKHRDSVLDLPLMVNREDEPLRQSSVLSLISMLTTAEYDEEEDFDDTHSTADSKWAIY